MERPSLLVIVLNYRTAEMTLRAAEAALADMAQVQDAARAELVIVDNNSGDGSAALLADAIASFAEADGRIEVWDEYRLVDEVARRVVTFSSDKHWTANYGHRTPKSYFGKMSPERSTENVETMDLDGLL